MSYNKVVLVGRLTKDVELKTAKNDSYYTNFSIAVNRRFDKETADFFNCTAFGKTAEFLEKYTSKGSLVLVDGSIQIDKYNDKYYTKIMADNVQLLSSKGDSETQDDEPKSTNVVNANKPTKSANISIDDDVDATFENTFDIDEDDLAF